MRGMGEGAPTGSALSNCRQYSTLGEARVGVEYLPKPHGLDAAVGIDLGLKDGLTLSTGAKVENSRVFARYEAELAVAQRANKARRVQAIHAKEAPPLARKRKGGEDVTRPNGHHQ